jgi:hypothetical protein
MSTTNRQVAKLPPEEPDAGKLHVRVCEGASGQPLALLGGDMKADKHSVPERSKWRDDLVECWCYEHQKTKHNGPHHYNQHTIEDLHRH